MFISNIEPNESTVLLDADIGVYLETHGVPLLGFSGDKHIFRDTALLRSKLKTLPIMLRFKLIMKGGAKFE
jgi:hypothetical protein